MADSGQYRVRAKAGRSRKRAAYLGELGELDDYGLGKPIEDLADVVPGMIIETTDKDGKRNVAKVLKLDEKIGGVFVHYPNWSSRYDEFITLMSSRLFILGKAKQEENAREEKKMLQEVRYVVPIIAKLHLVCEGVCASIYACAETFCSY